MSGDEDNSPLESSPGGVVSSPSLAAFGSRQMSHSSRGDTTQTAVKALMEKLLQSSS